MNEIKNAGFQCSKQIGVNFSSKHIHITIFHSGTPFIVLVNYYTTIILYIEETTTG